MSWRQLKSILWKNWLLKKAHIFGFMAEILLPVGFMALLIIIKGITQVYDSPNIAYYCGNAYPWFYSTSLYIRPGIEQVWTDIPATCVKKPDGCSVKHYYQSKEKVPDTELKGYTQLGYVQSAASSAVSSNPFYTYTIADRSTFYIETQIKNPSLDLCTVLHKIKSNHAKFALAPKDEDNEAATSATLALQQFMYRKCHNVTFHNGEQDETDSIIIFDSQHLLDKYMTNKNYDDHSYKEGKIAMAVVFNAVDVATAQWDYSVRVNYTSYLDEDDDTVACLYGWSGNGGCNFYYTIPTTKYHTMNLQLPQSADYMYGYTYTGFSTVQQTVDQFIFSQYAVSQFAYYSSMDNTEDRTSIGSAKKGIEAAGSARTSFPNEEEILLAQNSGNEVSVAAAQEEEQQQPEEEREKAMGAAIVHDGPLVDIMASVSLMPTAPYKTDEFQYVIKSVLGIFYMLSFLYPVSRIIRALVLEKESRIKEGMKMMGLTDTVYNLSWAITTVLQMSIVSVLITIVTSTTVFEYSNKYYVFLYFESFSLAVISMCFLIASFFSRSKSASLLGPVIFFASFFPYYAVSDAQYSRTAKTATCVLAPACFALGADVFADYEGGLVGVTGNNYSEETSNFTYDTCVYMMLFDALLYGFLAWYFDKVLPSEFGTPLPFYFPLLPSYWCGVRIKRPIMTKTSSNSTGSSSGSSSTFVRNKKKNTSRAGGGDNKGQYDLVTNVEVYEGDSSAGSAEINPLHRHLLADSDVYERSDCSSSGNGKKSRFFEPVSSELLQQEAHQECLTIRGLRKVFENLAGGDDRVAVEGLDLQLYQNQVTVLLGHNGAGKSTTISMLSGLSRPTSGTAEMPGGLFIHKDMQAIRRNLGICPQHDILFPELTVRQHLEMFADFKGVPSDLVVTTANRMIHEVGLFEKANNRSSTLSGGQKRKLSLGIALIGDSKVVILDEPTSGMDPHSRRACWNIIQRNKKNRVILLTTHFMDEADLLADRVAILAEGRLKCVGSPMFLKKMFGVGYTLTIVKGSPSAFSPYIKIDQQEDKQTICGEEDNYDETIEENDEEFIVVGASGTERRIRCKRGIGLAASRKETADKATPLSAENVSSQVAELVQCHVKEATVLTDVGAEQSFRLPFAASDRFVGLFSSLDRHSKRLGIAEYGISVTTLEEVFFRVGNMGENDGEIEDDENNSSSTPVGARTVQHSNSGENIISPTPDLSTVYAAYESPSPADRLHFFDRHAASMRAEGIFSHSVSHDEAFNPSARGEEDVHDENSHLSSSRTPYQTNTTSVRTERGMTTTKSTTTASIKNPMGDRSKTVRVAVTANDESIASTPPLQRLSTSRKLTFTPSTISGGSHISHKDVVEAIDSSNSSSSSAAPGSCSVEMQEADKIAAGGHIFFIHFWALLKKRAIYGKRDKRMFLCQIALPVLLVVIGVALLIIVPDFSQPDIVLSPKQLNSDMDKALRNFVPFYIAPSMEATPTPYIPPHVPQVSDVEVEEAVEPSSNFYFASIGDGNASVAELMESRFNGDETNGVYGIAVPVFHESADPLNDEFEGCSQGADALHNMSNYLIQSLDPIPEEEKGSSRYGAVTVADSTSLTNLSYNVMVNGSSMHGVGIYVNLVHQSFLQVLSNIGTAQIVAHNYPLPQTAKQVDESASQSAFVVATFCMIAFCFIPASLAVFVVKEREYKSKHQQIISGVSIYAYWASTYLWDCISYMPTAALVLAVIYAFDVSAFIQGEAATSTVLLLLLYGPATASMTYLVSFMFQSHSTAQIGVMFFNFVTGLCLMVVSFVLTLIENTAPVALKLRYVFRLFPSYCLGDGLSQLSLCWDQGNTCPKMTSKGYDYYHFQTPLSWDATGANIIFMVIQAVVYFALCLALEYGLTFPSITSWLYQVHDPGKEKYDEMCIKSSATASAAAAAGGIVVASSSSSSSQRESPVIDEDEDVYAERCRVMSGASTAANDIVTIKALRKIYPINGSRAGGMDAFNCVNTLILKSKAWVYHAVRSFTSGGRKVSEDDSATAIAEESVRANVKIAVDSLCFGIPKGECFAFLGINGAGKSSTLSILSGEYSPTAGTAEIAGYNILEDQSKIRRKIGYCPQFDALLELLTVREHLELYARIKCVTEGEALDRVVSRKMEQLDLCDFEHKIAGSLSGGNKRKLSVAIATIGDPSIIFLDEPSTGMDVVTRKKMWKIISQMSTIDGQCSVILTTHSMEEAEALCTRIGIMVNGKLTCLGSSQHLKHRFGSGFEVNVKLNVPAVELVVQIADRLVAVGLAKLNYSFNFSEHQQFNTMMDSADVEGAAIEIDRNSDHYLDAIVVRWKDLIAVCGALPEICAAVSGNVASGPAAAAAAASAVTISELLSSGVLLRQNRYQLLTTTSVNGIRHSSLSTGHSSTTVTAAAGMNRASSTASRHSHALSSSTVSSASAQVLHEQRETETMLHTSALESLREQVANARRISGSNTQGGAVTAASQTATGGVTMGGGIPIRALIEWWLAEDCAQSLVDYMHKQFGSRSLLQERSSLYNFRFRVQRRTSYKNEHGRPERVSSPVDSGGGRSSSNSNSNAASAFNGGGDGGKETEDSDENTFEEEEEEEEGNELAEIFSTFEQHKKSLAVSEYSVGQTTLEQIFNQFASQQDNPEATAQAQAVST